MAEWDYIDKLKGLNNNELYREYAKIQAQLDETSKPYAQRSRRKNDGLDNDYLPQDSPAYDKEFSQPTTSKKRKKPSTGKSMKRKRANFSGMPEMMDVPPVGTKRKKRKREDGPDGRKYQRNATTARRKNAFDDHSDEELGHPLKRRKFDVDSEDEISEGSDFGRLAVPGPQNEYSDLSLTMVVERLVKYTKKLEKIKLQKVFGEQIMQLSTDNSKLRAEKETYEDKMQNMDSERLMAEMSAKTAKQQLAAREQQFEKRAQSHKVLVERLKDSLKQAGGGFDIETESKDVLEKEREIQELKAQVADLQNKNRQLQNNARNGKVQHPDTKDLKDQIWVEQKFSKEVQTHYKSLAEYFGKSRRDEKTEKFIEAKDAEIVKLKSEIKSKDTVIRQQREEIERQKAILKQNQAAKSNAKRNRKKNLETKKKSKPPTIPNLDVSVSSKASSSTKTFSRKDIDWCSVCCSMVGDLYRVDNPAYDESKPTEWVQTKDNGLQLSNQPYCLFHKRCTRGEHLKGIPERLFNDPMAARATAE